MPPSRSTDRKPLALWPSRLRWRLRGAMQWPAFAVLLCLDAVLLARLPFAGEGAGLVPSVLVAGFMNLAVLAVAGPLGGALLRRRRAALPREVAADTAATAGMLALAALLVVGGLAHRPAVREADSSRAAAVAAARGWIGHHAPPQYRAGLDRGDTWSPGPDLFRVCFPGGDPRRALCLLVRTDEGLPIVRRDPDQRPNATVAGPDNPGRRGG